MKKKKLTLIGSVCLILVLAALPFMAACAPEEEAPAPPPEVIELSWTIPWPSVHFVNAIQIPAWIADIEERTEGRVKITIYHGGTLVGATETYDGVVDGIADIGLSSLAYTPGRFPLMMLAEAPGIGYNNAVVNSLVATEIYMKFKPAEFDEVKVLNIHSLSPGVLITKSPVRTLEDLKGMEIRSPGAITTTLLEQLGATPVGMPMPESYLALQKGIVEGIINPFSTLVDWKIAEVTEYVTAIHLYNMLFFVVMNLDTWNALPPDIQKIFDEVSEEQVKKAGEIWDKNEVEDAASAVKDYGMEIIQLSPEEKAIWEAIKIRVRDEAVAEVEAKGLPAREVFDEILRLVEKYNKLYPNVAGM